MTQHPASGPPAGSAHAARRLAAAWWLPAAGVLLVVGGIVLLAQGPAATDIGWMAYTPLPQDGLPGGIMLYNRSMLAGALLVLAGAVLLAFWGGLQIGRRRSAGRERPPSPSPSAPPSAGPAA